MSNFRRYGDKIINRDYTANKRWLRESKEETELSRYIDRVLTRMAIAITVCFMAGTVGYLFWSALK